jgi:ABC-type multidrug transport system ATPase subunit
MDETEALCTKIGIMVNGELKCYGSLQHLKRRYGDGYTLLVKISFDPQQSLVTEFISFFLSSFQQSRLRENQDGFINIHINDNSPRLFALIFQLIEENKSKYSIEYYVVTQTNLEQIFLSFASKQINSNIRNLPKSYLPSCF